MKSLKFLVLLLLILIPASSGIFGFGSELKNCANELTYQIMNSRYNSEFRTMIKKEKIIKIAVIEFASVDGNNLTLAKMLTEEFTEKLRSTKKFDIIDKGLVNNVLTELSQNISSRFDSESVKKLGEKLGIKVLIVGKILELDKTIGVNTRILSGETGFPFGFVTTEMKKNEEIKKLLTQDNPNSESQSDETQLK